MASDMSPGNSHICFNENEISMNKSAIVVDKDKHNEQEEATVPKVNEESTVKTPLMSMNDEGSTRKVSFSSASSKSSDSPDICRICHCEETDDERLISPCLCLGTMQYLHQACLQRWIKSAGVRSCELCKFEFIMHSEIKPFRQWQKLDMNVIEKRKIMCSIVFNLIAATCVLLSLYVLIEKTRDEVRAGKLEWPFWTKLIVVAVGFTGGLVFLYVQCKMYLQLCIRWRQFNQRIVIHSINEQRSNGMLLSETKTIKTTDSSGGNCIITVLDANDLPPLYSNTLSSVPSGNTSTDSAYSQPSNVRRNRRDDNPPNNRNVLHRFFIFHRSDPS